MKLEYIGIVGVGLLLVSAILLISSSEVYYKGTLTPEQKRGWSSLENIEKKFVPTDPMLFEAGRFVGYAGLAMLGLWFFPTVFRLPKKEEMI